MSSSNGFAWRLWSENARCADPEHHLGRDVRAQGHTSLSRHGGARHAELELSCERCDTLEGLCE